MVLYAEILSKLLVMDPRANPNCSLPIDIRRSDYRKSQNGLASSVSTRYLILSKHRFPLFHSRNISLYFVFCLASTQVLGRR